MVNQGHYIDCKITKEQIEEDLKTKEGRIRLSMLLRQQIKQRMYSGIYSKDYFAHYIRTYYIYG